MRVFSLYAHLQKFHTGVRVGKKGKKGDLIGYCGMSGLVRGVGTASHLHLEIFKDFKEAGGYELDKWFGNQPREWIRERYFDPYLFIEKHGLQFPMVFTGNYHGGDEEWAGGKFVSDRYKQLLGWWHLGVDFNEGSGNQDLGKPIYAIADYEVRLLKSSNHTPSYGNRLVLEYNLPTDSMNKEQEKMLEETRNKVIGLEEKLGSLTTKDDLEQAISDVEGYVVDMGNSLTTQIKSLKIDSGDSQEATRSMLVKLRDFIDKLLKK